MKRLAILRHAKSSSDDQQFADFDRPLNERGWKAARRVGRELKKRGIDFDLVLASPAVRVRETLQGGGMEAEIRFEPYMYLASEQQLFEFVRYLPETVHAPLLVGHNPGLQQLVVALTRDDRVERKLPTAAFVRIELAADKWSDVEPGSGTIADLIFPKELG